MEREKRAEFQVSAEGLSVPQIPADIADSKKPCYCHKGWQTDL